VASTTDFLAAWGAVVATIVATWNIYRDFIKRDRVLVEAGFHIWSVTGNKVFFLKVVNLASRAISVTHCIGYDKRVSRRRWMQRLLGRHPSGYLFAFETLNRIRLPAKIEPGDHQMFLYSINASFPQGDLGVITADSREWFCSRSDITAIHKDEAYKRLHATNDKKGPERSTDGVL
jgi:hypothetical protein